MEKHATISTLIKYSDNQHKTQIFERCTNEKDDNDKQTRKKTSRLHEDDEHNKSYE